MTLVVSARAVKKIFMIRDFGRRTFITGLYIAIHTKEVCSGSRNAEIVSPIVA
jgi:hypothetical protein